MSDQPSALDPIAAAERIERLIDPAEFDVPPPTVADMRVRALYIEPTHDLADPIAQRAVDARSMPAVRAILASFDTDLVRLISNRRAGDPPVAGAFTRGLNLLLAAEAEVVRAERGCGRPEGECTDPCHAGVIDESRDDAAGDADA